MRKHFEGLAAANNGACSAGTIKIKDALEIKKPLIRVGLSLA